MDPVSPSEETAERRQAEWTCVSCGGAFVVDWDREPESCPTCGCVNLIPIEEGF